MNFDDLHDPQPPRPGPAALAAVSGRARQLRRRRAALTVAGGMAALAAIVVPAALVVIGDDGEGNRIVPATVPETTVAPETTVPTVAPTDPPPVSTLAPVPAGTPLAAAILGNGDAAVIAADLSTRVAFDGADPSDPAAEGLGVADVVVTPGGRVFVSTCCEPVAGTWFEVDASGQPASDTRFGHALELSPDGTRLASVGASGITVTDLDGAVLASVDLSSSPVYRQPESVMWLDDQTLAIIELRQPDPGPEFRLYTVDAGLTTAPAAEGVVIGTDLEATWPHFGGVADDGSIFVYRGARGGTVSDRLEAHDPVSLAPRPASDLVIDDEMAAVDAWYRDGSLTWVGMNDELHVGEDVVPGEFAWARPVS